MRVTQSHLSLLLQDALFKAVTLPKSTLWEKQFQILFLKVTKFLIFQHLDRLNPLECFQVQKTNSSAEVYGLFLSLLFE